MLKNFLSKFLLMIFLIFSIIFLLKPYLSTTFPYTHDGMNHLARFANYKIALREGQFPPRLAPNLLNHYAYPVFNYNYPLANILSLPFSIIGFNYELTFKIIVVFSLILACLGITFWLKSRKDKLTIVFSLVVFLLNPYLINLIFFRGNIGEILALSLLPWLFYSLEKFKTKSTVNSFDLLLWTAFLLSHNVTVLFGSGILIVYAILIFKNNLQAYKKLAFVFIGSILLSLWFWLPALAEKNQIVLDNANLNIDFLTHFPTLKELLLAPLEFGFSRVGSVDDLSFSLGLVQILIIVLSFILLFINQKFAQKNKFLIILILACLVFQLSLTQKIWQVLPLVSFIQFPWRLTLFISILILPLAAQLWQFNKIRLILLFLLLIQIINLSRLKPADQFHYQKVDYEAFSQTTSTQNENLAKTFKYQNFADWQPTAKILNGEGEIKINYWFGSKREYQLHLTTDATIIEPSMNYLGWQTWANQQKISYFDNEQIAGRIAYQLKAGDYLIKTKFTQQTPARLIGNFVSLSAGLIYLILLFKNKYAKKN